MLCILYYICRTNRNVPLLKGTHQFLFPRSCAEELCKQKNYELILLCLGLSLPLACWPFPTPHHILTSAFSWILLTQNFNFLPGVLLSLVLAIVLISLPGSLIRVCVHRCVEDEEKREEREKREKKSVCYFSWLCFISCAIEWMVQVRILCGLCSNFVNR